MKHTGNEDDTIIFNMELIKYSQFQPIKLINFTNLDVILSFFVSICEEKSEKSSKTQEFCLLHKLKVRIS